MKMMFSWVVSLLLCLILPLYISYIFEQFKGKHWGKAIAHTVIGAITATAVFFLGYYGLAPTTASAAKRQPKLEYMSKANLEEEVPLRKQQNPGAAQAIDGALQIIKTKFDEADYAQQKGDLDRALRLYSEMQQGSDENGSFATFPSICIMNNMAITYFRKQGDKQFKASSMLLDASRLLPRPAHQAEIIQRNFDALDDYVNH